MKSDVGLFSQLYVGCQTRDGNLEEFFCRENQASLPSLSDGSNLHLVCKSDLLICLEDHCDTQTEPPVTRSIIVDGAAIVQMLKPAAAKKLCRLCL